MELKKYTPVQIELIYLHANDVCTVSAPDYDHDADHDVGGGDIFND